mmetsp:Transcript_17834/g.26390  ORF Transcript_17834/g.26390 Transcript_17834/m.26390 type:complete len:330 (+) Transcript_17834:173-1162(+)
MELIDRTDSALTISWPEVNGAKRYKLQYSRVSTSDEIKFETLSDQLTTSQARKRNLEGDCGFFFRAGAIIGDEEEPEKWITHSDAFYLLSEEQSQARMPQLKVESAGYHAVKVSWNASDGAVGYELQMRENKGGAPWKTIAASFSGIEVRKKNLTSAKGYTFRARPVGINAAFSIPSEGATGADLSDGIRRIFSVLEGNELLINKATSVPLSDALAGKDFILLYVSAHWCPPCRQFTPMLINWYQKVKNIVEIVFLSADHDESGFKSYYASMPWTAVGFDDDGREKLMGYIKVTGIPRLVVLDGKTGNTLVDNAVSQPLDIAKWRALSK